MRTKQKIKMRKSMRYTYIIISLVLFAFSTSFFIKELFYKKTSSMQNEIYTYKTNLNTKYSVNLKENKFIDEKELPMGQVYVSDLIQNINMDINYNYQASEKTDIEYTYNIKGILRANFSKDGNSKKVWEKEYILLDNKSNNINDNKFQINENVQIDVNQYNKEINEFEQQMGMALDAKMYIVLQVNANTKISKTDVNNEYKSNIIIDLGEKTTEVSGNLNDEKIDKKYEEVQKQEKIDIVKIIIYGIMLIISINLLKYVLTQTRSGIRLNNEYRRELNKILRFCQDKIVEVNNKIEVVSDNLIEVKDIEELIKLSEELFKPILYYELTDRQEAWFCVISNNITYRFILKD